MEGEYILENSKLLESMIDKFYEANGPKQNAINNKVGLKNALTGIAGEVKSNPKLSRAVNARIEGKRRTTATGAMRNETETGRILGNYVKAYVEGECVKAGEKLGKNRKDLQKQLQVEVATIFKNTNIRIEEVNKAKQVTGNTNEKKQEGYTPEEREQYLKEGYVECDNLFYNSELLTEGDYQSNTRKTFKATVLTVLVFIVSLVLTNMVRVYFGGTPGGDFASPVMKNLFMMFSCLILAPIIEEPAKLISVKGGYGKHFFFMFNFLEFGLYVMMMVAGGTTLGMAVLIRGIAVLMHAITSRVLASSKGRGFFNTTFKLAISILLHFIFNTIFLKYTLFGIAGNSLLLFVIGFFAAAFGLFVVSKLFKPKQDTYSNYNFTTTSNLEPRYSYGYA